METRRPSNLQSLRAFILPFPIPCLGYYYISSPRLSWAGESLEPFFQRNPSARLHPLFLAHWLLFRDEVYGVTQNMTCSIFKIKTSAQLITFLQFIFPNGCARTLSIYINHVHGIRVLLSTISYERSCHGRRLSKSASSYCFSPCSELSGDSINRYLFI